MPRLTSHHLTSPCLPCPHLTPTNPRAKVQSQCTWGSIKINILYYIENKYPKVCWDEVTCLSGRVVVLWVLPCAALGCNGRCDKAACLSVSIGPKWRYIKVHSAALRASPHFLVSPRRAWVTAVGEGRAYAYMRLHTRVEFSCAPVSWRCHATARTPAAPDVPAWPVLPLEYQFWRLHSR